MPVSVVGTKRMTYGEAWHLTRTLAGDVSSQVCAAVNGYARPVSEEWLLLRALMANAVALKTEKSPKLLMPPDSPLTASTAPRHPGVSPEEFDRIITAHREGASHG